MDTPKLYRYNMLYDAIKMLKTTIDIESVVSERPYIPKDLADYAVATNNQVAHGFIIRISPDASIVGYIDEKMTSWNQTYLKIPALHGMKHDTFDLHPFYFPDEHQDITKLLHQLQDLSDFARTIAPLLTDLYKASDEFKTASEIHHQKTVNLTHLSKELKRSIKNLNKI